MPIYHFILISNIVGLNPTNVMISWKLYHLSHHTKLQQFTKYFILEYVTIIMELNIKNRVFVVAHCTVISRKQQVWL